ncbi:MAG: hypothetical protein JO154_07490 [Chitinophaga sp.]|uniref:hypothetical protein n=1 Tax=Chitinophaga sp. TaxID=1869181 RepID=UPI0025BF9037|nr:hypothetical protein [Chitinophaga sp.]MBV8252435.1 hypothetical protein [Chitinophaga sp.]
MYRRFVKWYIKRKQRKAAAITDPKNPRSKNYILENPGLTEEEKQLYLKRPPIMLCVWLGITYPLWEVPDPA